MGNLTHFNSDGRARMVDVNKKEITIRSATARGSVKMKNETLLRVKDGSIFKGDVLAVAQVAGIMGAKNTPNCIPMCHPIQITGVDINFAVAENENRIHIEAIISCEGKTGVEMEALTAVSIAALTIYDMCKSIDKGIIIENIRLVRKTGGKSGEFIRENEVWDI